MRTLIVIASVLLCAFALPERRYHAEHIERVRHAATVIGTINPDERYADFWNKEAAEGIRTHEARNGADGPVAKNLVMYLGDGMSVTTLAAARTLMGQLAKQTGEETQLSFEKFPTLGLSKTYCVNQQIPDSACTATAYLCGVKNNYGTLGVNANVPRHNCTASLDKSTHLESIAAWALAEGKDVGIVTTTRITHASPAGAYAQSANRGWENDAAVREAGHDPDDCPDIAHQLIHGEPGNRFKVILGGGRREFTPTTSTGETGGSGLRTDNRNLVEEWKAQKVGRNQTHSFVYDRATLNTALQEDPEFLFGLFHANHLRYAVLAPDTQPTLSELTAAAIQILSKNEKGFFLFVEGGRIDHAHHDNFPMLALTETIEFSKAVEVGQNLLGDDALIVVTSDHSHVMAYNGYSPRGADILGLSNQLDDHNVPYLTLSYTNGPGFREHVNGSRTILSEETDFLAPEWMAHVDAPLDSETHGGEDVAVFAIGPQHQAFTGVYEQSRIPHLMAYIGCIGDGPRAPACNSSYIAQPFTMLIFALAIMMRW